MTCEWQMGMLVLRPCGAPASEGCSVCGRSVCAAHTLVGQNGPACPDCAATKAGYDETDDTELADSRRQYFMRYGGAAKFGQRGFFSDADSAAMARPIVSPLASRSKYDPRES